MQATSLSTVQLRKFGFILSSGLIILFALIPWLRHHEVYAIPSLIGLGIMIIGVIMPKVLKVIYDPWMKFGSILGWINTRIILSVIYFGLITPIGIIMRLCGQDTMKRRYDPQAKTYRIITKQTQPQDMERPF